MTEYTSTTSPAVFETDGQTHTWRVSNVGTPGPAGEGGGSGGAEFPDQTTAAGAALVSNGVEGEESWGRGVSLDSGGDRVADVYVDDVDGDGYIAHMHVSGPDSAEAGVKATEAGDVEVVATGVLTVNGREVDVSGGSSGDVVTFDGTKLALDAPSGGGGGGGAADASRLYTPGSGVDGSNSDEFDDASLDGAWTRVDRSGGTGRATWTEAAGCLSLILNGNSSQDNDGELHGLVRAYALGVGEYIETHISWAGDAYNYPNAGLVVADGTTYTAGVQANGSVWPIASGGLIVGMGRWTGWDTRADWTNGTPYFYGGGYMRVVRSASTTYDLYLSPDGVSWAFFQTRSASLTPSHVGFAGGAWSPGTGQFAFSFEYFRVGS